MQDAGCVAVRDLTHKSAMLTGAFRLVGEAVGLLREVDRLFAGGGVDLFVPVDSPTFNLPLAHRAKARRLPVVYFIAPQVWAWAEFRIHKVRRRTDKLMVILPFEEGYFQVHGIDARFVGHPLMESLSRQAVDRSVVESLRGPGSPVIACLPGSRRHVVQEILPGQLEVCRTIAGRYPAASFLFAAARDELADMIRDRIPATDAGPALRHRIETGRNGELISAADLVLVASGTATLEVAWHRKPMVIMYNASRWGYELVAKHLIRTPHLSLVNILAGKRLAPEFMPYYRSTEPIAQAALDLLADQRKRDEMSAGLDELVRSLGTHHVADEAASIVIETLGSTAPLQGGPKGSTHRVW
jgi:lipid-A-disaccharide synthase